MEQNRKTVELKLKRKKKLPNNQTLTEQLDDSSNFQRMRYINEYESNIDESELSNVNIDTEITKKGVILTSVMFPTIITT